MYTYISSRIMLGVIGFIFNDKFEYYLGHEMHFLQDLKYKDNIIVIIISSMFFSKNNRLNIVQCSYVCNWLNTLIY